VLGLPDGVRACLVDLDGVLTQTAKVHAAAWKEMFDGYLRERAAHGREEFTAFDAVDDYDVYVDGKPRYEGVRSFLDSRGIELPQGDSGDAADAQTIDGLGNRKNAIVLRMIRSGGVKAYQGAGGWPAPGGCLIEQQLSRGAGRRGYRGSVRAADRWCGRRA
jgi:beta-phosphoglucomutase-like phosphatase (HAD superfamily)